MSKYLRSLSKCFKLGKFFLHPVINGKQLKTATGITITRDAKCMEMLIFQVKIIWE